LFDTDGNLIWALDENALGTVYTQNPLHTFTPDCNEISNIGNVKTAEIRIYPAVTEGNVIIEAPEGSKVQVTDMVGRTVNSYSSVKFGQTININHTKGIYFVIVENGNVRKVQKVILK
jgi:hypothetical protein